MIGNCDSCKRRSVCANTDGKAFYGYCDECDPLAETIYKLYRCWDGFQLCRMRVGDKKKWYLKSYRNGNDVWVSDYTYAKRYSYKTAKKHLLRLRDYTNGSVAIVF